VDQQPSSGPSTEALFAGLVVDESGRPLAVKHIGGVAYYVLDDQGFERHVEAEAIDREVLRSIKEQALANREEVTRGMLTLLGRDDLFTKGMVDTSLENMDRFRAQALPESARAWLGMLGFRVIVNLHGEIVRLALPSGPPDEGGE
jgi:hypothetical protein